MAKKVTVKDIAENLKISPTTVSFVLNGRDKGISTATAEKIFQKASELGYVRTTRMNMRDWIRAAYIVPSISAMTQSTTFFQNVYNHLNIMGEKHKIEFIIRELKPDAPGSILFRQEENLYRQDIDVFLTSQYAIAELLEQKSCKTVIIQPGRAVSDFMCVFCDDTSAGRICAEKAFEAGHRKAGMLFPKRHEPHMRFQGFLSRFRELGGTCEEQHQWFCTGPIEGLAEQLTDRIKSQPSSSLPSVFYCFADNLMFPMIRAFSTCGFSIPDDISLLGTDNLFWGSMATPSFSTVDLQEKLFAEKTIQAIKDIYNGKAIYQLAIPVQFLKRQTLKDINPTG